MTRINSVISIKDIWNTITALVPATAEAVIKSGIKSMRKKTPVKKAVAAGEGFLLPELPSIAGKNSGKRKTTKKTADAISAANVFAGVEKGRKGFNSGKIDTANPLNPTQKM